MLSNRNIPFQVATSVSDGESLSPEYDMNGKGQRVIGGLPIADYEGSPRRYGPKQPPSAVTLLSSPSFYTPRPGFPQVRDIYLFPISLVTLHISKE